jgi:hypothetical protein
MPIKPCLSSGWEFSFASNGKLLRRISPNHGPMVVAPQVGAWRGVENPVHRPVKKVPGARRAINRQAEAYLGSTLERGD